MVAAAEIAGVLGLLRQELPRSVEAITGHDRRVLLDVRPLQGPSATGDVGTYLRGLTSALLAEGYGDRLALLVDAGRPSPDLPSALPAYAVRRRWRGRLRSYEEAAALGWDLDRIRPALYHGVDLNLPRRAPCPVVVTVRDLIPWAYGGPRMWGERLHYWTGKRLLASAELVLAVSQSAADDAVRFARVRADRIRVVPEGVDGAFKPRGPAARERVSARHGVEKPYLLFVGELDARKDPRGLLRAWRRARAEGADVDLVLAGGVGAQLRGARQLGSLEVDELADLLSAAACLVFSSRYEGFALPVAEAMACGCPIVAYANSSIPELAGEAALLVPDGHAGQLGAAAARVVLEPDLAARLRQAGLRRAKRFDWRKTARATIAAYRGLLR